MPFTASTVSGAVSAAARSAGLGGTSSLNASNFARVNRSSTPLVISRYWEPSEELRQRLVDDGQPQCSDEVVLTLRQWVVERTR